MKCISDGHPVDERPPSVYSYNLWFLEKFVLICSKNNLCKRNAEHYLILLLFVWLNLFKFVLIHVIFEINKMHDELKEPFLLSYYDR